MDHGTNRNVLNRQAVAGLDVGILGRNDLVADLQALGSEDICLLAVLVLNESDVSGTVRIILHGLNLGVNVELLTLEVNDTVLLLVAAADVANGDAAVAVAASGLLDLFEKALLGLHLRQTLVGKHSHISARGRRRVESLDSHLEFQLLDTLLSGWLPHTKSLAAFSIETTVSIELLSPRRGVRKSAALPYFYTTARALEARSRMYSFERGLSEKVSEGNFFGI